MPSKGTVKKMNEIHEKTKIPLGWAVTIIMSLSGMVGTGAVAHYRLTRLENDWQSYQNVMEAKSDVDRVQELKIQRLEITLQSIEASLNRIDARLERMETKR